MTAQNPMNTLTRLHFKCNKATFSTKLCSRTWTAKPQRSGKFSAGNCAFCNKLHLDWTYTENKWQEATI